MTLDQLAAIADNALPMPWEGPGDVPYSAKADLTKAITPAVALALIAVCRAAKAHVESMDEYDGDLVPMNRTRGTTRPLREALAALEAKEQP